MIGGADQIRLARPYIFGKTKLAPRPGGTRASASPCTGRGLGRNPGVPEQPAGFAAAGIEVESSLHHPRAPRTRLTCLDPRKGELGEDSKNYMYDVAAAKQMIAAAGYPDGFDMDYFSARNNTTTSTRTSWLLPELSA